MAESTLPIFQFIAQFDNIISIYDSWYLNCLFSIVACVCFQTMLIWELLVENIFVCRALALLIQVSQICVYQLVGCIIIVFVTDSGNFLTTLLSFCYAPQVIQISSSRYLEITDQRCFQPIYLFGRVPNVCCY